MNYVFVKGTSNIYSNCHLYDNLSKGEQYQKMDLIRMQ